MEILRRKIRELIYGTDGVALVVTLALFMFLYVSCAGVFAVGRSIKERVLLQNAADAAAYSAAVVQADTLSRIAAINRAMAWTYKDMIRCQHDYVLLTWLKDAYYKYLVDTEYAGYGDGAGTSPGCMLINDDIVSASKVADAIKTLSAVEDKIGKDQVRIKNMNKLASELIDKLPDRIGATVDRILEANLSGEYGKQCLYKVEIDKDGWWTYETSEDDFIGSGANYLRAELDDKDADVDSDDSMDTGTWFRRSDSSPISRYYYSAADLNKATWWYRTGPLDDIHQHKGASLLWEWSKYVDKPSSMVNGPAAKPIVLKKEFFPGGDDDGKSKGAITVCVAHRTDNPWKFGSTGAFDGMYDAFKPYSKYTRWARAVSSAQAGYHKHGAEDDVYSVRWEDEKDWNLHESDWDAVFVPVRKVFTGETFKNLITDSSGWKKVLENGYDDLESSYAEDLDVATQLPRMHNTAGTDDQINWDDSGFLDSMFH